MAGYIQAIEAPNNHGVHARFVERNERPWTHPAGGLEETATMIERLAGEPPALTEEEFRAWATRNIS